MKNILIEILLFVDRIKSMTMTRESESSADGKKIQEPKKYDNYGFGENGLDIDGRDIEYYKYQLRDMYRREKVWHSDSKYDVKVYSSRRNLETILMLVLKHNYGPEFLEHTEQRSLCSYIKTVYDNNLLGWSAQRLEEINSVKCYMNNIIHAFQRSYNAEKHTRLKRSMSKLKEEFKRSIGLYALDNTSGFHVDISQHKDVA